MIADGLNIGEARKQTINYVARQNYDSKIPPHAAGAVRIIFARSAL